MKQLIASGALAFAIVAAQPAAAGTTVVFDGNETTNWASLWKTLPGEGSYTFEFTASAPVSYNLFTSYDYHWDVFVAPAPKPHNEYVEGNDNPVEDYTSGLASSFTYVFDVPTMWRSFFIADDMYEGYGIAPGTKMYREIKYLNPYFEFSAERPDGEDFSYNLKVSRFISVVPEPGTWAMMIIGFGAVGSAVRVSRRRNMLSVA